MKIFLYILDMRLELSVSTHFHVSESWKFMKNECYLTDINIFLNNCRRKQVASFSPLGQIK